MMNKKIFSGLKVAEFSWAVVGPSTSKYLAEHGATVVKIESHSRLDTLKGTNPFANGKAELNGSMCYGRYNVNKYGVTLDLSKPGGQKIALKLIEWADIVTETFSPTIMSRWGLDYESVKKIKPSIIYLSSSMQGRGGPHSSYAGYGHNACALSGFAELSGWPDLPPAPPYGPYTDFICPRFNAAALIAALLYRNKTGKGQWLEQSQFETSLHFLAPLIMDYQVNNKVATRQGNKFANSAPHGLFPCQGDDCWVAIGIFTDEDWKTLCKLMEKPELISNSDYSTLKNRKENENTLETIISKWTLQFPGQHLENLLQQSGLACHILAKPSDVYADNQLAHRKYFTPLKHPEMGTQLFEPQSCFILSETPRKTETPPPCLGQHNEYVFSEILGMRDDEIAEGIIDGSITVEMPVEFKMSM